MKARKYKISKKPLSVVKENTSDHITDTVSYTCRPYTLPSGIYDSRAFEINSNIIGIKFNQDEFNKWMNKLSESLDRIINSKIPLQEQLNQALENEDYERAAELRDKIKKK